MRSLNPKPKKFCCRKDYPSLIVYVALDKIQARSWHLDCDNQRKLWVVFLISVHGTTCGQLE